mmetsp:Transcript_7190/g.15640  ORF Transcript_7190/g.15640 Transcript_7190/m.15640 type:complete len:240 (-) Transcript_7190:84-803(-)
MHLIANHGLPRTSHVVYPHVPPALRRRQHRRLRGTPLQILHRRIVDVVPVRRVRGLDRKRRIAPGIASLLPVLGHNVVRHHGMSRIPHVHVPVAIRRGETAGRDAGPVDGVSLRGVSGVDEEGILAHPSRRRRELGFRCRGGGVLLPPDAEGTTAGAVQHVQCSPDVVQAHDAAVAPHPHDVGIVRTHSNPIDSPARVRERIMLQHRIQFLLLAIVIHAFVVFAIIAIVLVVVVFPLLS